MSAARVVKELHLLRAMGYSYLSSPKISSLARSVGSFELLKEQISSCSLCHLSYADQNRALNDNTNAKIIFISLVSLCKASEQKILNIATQALGLSQSCYGFTSLLRCGTGKPDKTSFMMCKEFLLDELSFCKAKACVILGRELFEVLGFEASFESCLGEVLEISKLPALVGFDLRYISQNPSRYLDFVTMLKRIGSFV